MAVYSGPFIIPSFILRSIHTNHEHVVLPISEGVGHITEEAAIAAGIAAKIESIDPDLAVSINAVKTDDDATAGVRRSHSKMLTVPSNAGGRIMTAHRFVAMRHHARIL